jgi:CheY-like chemotaxis protein
MTSGGFKIFMVDDSATALALARRLLEPAGHQVESTSEPTEALELIRKSQPDLVILDVMMPRLNGFELCRMLRKDPELAEMPIIMASAKAYESDREKARRLGASGYIIKPFTLAQFDAIALSLGSMVLSTWGVRGTLPMPQQNYIGYGGNTSCYSLQVAGDHHLVFDAGTGIKSLSNALMASNGKRLTIEMFITHPHWDHINGFPFFAPLYIAGNSIRVHGARQDEIGFEQLMLGQMDGVYFPVTAREFSARVTFNEIAEQEVDIGIDGVRVRSLLLKHPGHCLGYRVDFQNRSLCYITDNELYPANSDFADEEFMHALADFCRGANVLIHDSTYFDNEYTNRVHWGHSSLSEVCRLAHLAEAERLWIHHHDPDQNDHDIECKLEFCMEVLAALGSKTRPVLPKEGTSELV